MRNAALLQINGILGQETTRWRAGWRAWLTGELMGAPADLVGSKPRSAEVRERLPREFAPPPPEDYDL